MWFGYLDKDSHISIFIMVRFDGSNQKHAQKWELIFCRSAEQNGFKKETEFSTQHCCPSFHKGVSVSS